MPDATQSRNSRDPLDEVVAAFCKLETVDWSVALMLASLLEPMSAGALEIEFRKAYLKDEKGDNLTEQRIAESLTYLSSTDIVTGGRSDYFVTLELSHRLVGAAALQTDPPPKAFSKTKTEKTKPERSETGRTARRKYFEAICHHVLRESGIHPFGFFGIDRAMHDLREIRALYWLGDTEALNERLEESQACFNDNDDIANLFVQPVDRQRLAKLSPQHRSTILEMCLVTGVDQLLPCGKLLDELSRLSRLSCPPLVWRTMGEVHLLRGESARVEKIIATLESEAASKSARSNSREAAEWLAEASQLRGCLHFARGENENAIVEFEACLAFLKGNSRRKKLCPRGLGGLFFVLALCRQQTP